MLGSGKSKRKLLSLKMFVLDEVFQFVSKKENLVLHQKLKNKKVFNITLKSQICGLVDRTLKGHTDSVTCVIQLSDGRIASSSFDKSIIIWDINSCSPAQQLTGHTGVVNCIIQLKDSRIASVSKDRMIKLWDLQSYYSCTQNLIGHEEGICSIIQLKDGNLVSVSERSIFLWDITTVQFFQIRKNIFTSQAIELETDD